MARLRRGGVRQGLDHCSSLLLPRDEGGPAAIHRCVRSCLVQRGGVLWNLLRWCSQAETPRLGHAARQPRCLSTLGWLDSVRRQAAPPPRVPAGLAWVESEAAPGRERRRRHRRRAIRQVKTQAPLRAFHRPALGLSTARELLKPWLRNRRRANLRDHEDGGEERARRRAWAA